jgi:hypothetical protein
MSTSDIRSVSDHVKDLRAAPNHWIDTAIVVAFHDRFEFVREDCPDPSGLLRSLEAHGGVAIGLAGIYPADSSPGTFLAKVFPEFEGQAWMHRHMDRLRRIVSNSGNVADPAHVLPYRAHRE